MCFSTHVYRRQYDRVHSSWFACHAALDINRSVLLTFLYEGKIIKVRAQTPRSLFFGRHIIHTKHASSTLFFVKGCCVKCETEGPSLPEAGNEFPSTSQEFENPMDHAKGQCQQGAMSSFAVEPIINTW